MPRLVKKIPPHAATRRSAAASKRSATLAELNKRLAESRDARLQRAEANCIKLTGKSRL